MTVRCTWLVIALVVVSGCSEKRLRRLDASAMDGDGATPMLDSGSPTPMLDSGGPTPVLDSGGAPVERYFTPSSATGVMLEPFLLCPGQAIAGAHAVVRVRVPNGVGCETAGTITSSVDASRRRIELHPSSWIEHGVACATSGTAALRQAIVTLPEPGSWVIAAGAGEHMIEVRPPARDGCASSRRAQGQLCERDCDCDPGLFCVVAPGPRCEAQCFAPCGGATSMHSGSCSEGLACIDGADPMVLGCHPRSEPACGPTAPCGPGQRCDAMAGECVWDIAPYSEHRPCTTNADCEIGRDCVEWTIGDPSSRRCQIRCVANDMICPTGTPGLCAEHGTCDERTIP